MVEEKAMAVSSEGLPTQTFRRITFSGPRRWLWRYGPLLLWAAMIFIGSTDLLSGSNTERVLWPLSWLFTQANEATRRTLHFVLRKAGNLTRDAMLALLV